MIKEYSLIKGYWGLWVVSTSRSNIALLRTLLETLGGRASVGSRNRKPKVSSQTLDL